MRIGKIGKFFNAIMRVEGQGDPMAGVKVSIPIESDVSRQDGSLASADAKAAKLHAELKRAYGPPEAESKPAAPAKPEPPKDPWEAKFKTATYYVAGPAFVIHLRFIEELAKRAGIEIYTEEERKRLCDLGARWEDARDELGKVGHDAVQRRFSELIRWNEESIHAGEMPNELPNKHDVEHEVAARRAQLRGELKATGILAAPVLAVIIQRLIAAAKEVAEDLDREEREAAAGWELPFVPSYQLRAVVWFAIDGADYQLRMFSPGSLANPNQVIFGCLHPHKAK
jgi:hypothetical protein